MNYECALVDLDTAAPHPQNEGLPLVFWLSGTNAGVDAHKKLKPALDQGVDAPYFVDPNSLTDAPFLLSRTFVWVEDQVVEHARLGVGVCTRFQRRSAAVGGTPPPQPAVPQPASQMLLSA